PERTTISVPGAVCRTSRIASSPSMPGILMSVSSTSTSPCATLSSTSSPLSTAPQIVNPSASQSSAAQMPLRISGSSSAINSLYIRLLLHLRGQRNVHPCPALGALAVQRQAERRSIAQRDALLDVAQADVICGLAPFEPKVQFRHRLGREAVAVVGHADGEPPILPRDADADGQPRL